MAGLATSCGGKEKASLPDQFTWGYAGIPPAVADLDGDGLDELISLYPVCFWVADGAPAG